MKRLHRRIFFIVSASLFFILLLLAPFSFNRPAAVAQSDSHSTPTASVRPLMVAQVVATHTPTRTPIPVDIGDFVWDDLDSDGQQDVGEPGLGGVTVQLWNAAKTDLIAQTVTDANGNYSVIAPMPGDYRVRVLLPNGLDQFSPKDAVAMSDVADSDINPTGADFGFTDIFNIGPGISRNSSKDAGIIRYMTPTPTRTPIPVDIGDFVWDDLDSDGQQDVGEPGLGGVTVQLWNAAKTDLIAQTVTDANGNYSVIAPMPGDYRVRVLLPNGLDQFSPKDAVAMSDVTDSDINPTGADFGFTDIFNIGPGISRNSSKDAGIIRYITPTPTVTPTLSAPSAPPVLNYRRLSFVTLSWNTVTWATGYAVQLDNNANFTSPEYENTTLGPSARSVVVFLPIADAVYYWRSGAKRADGTILWSPAQRLTVDMP